MALDDDPFSGKAEAKFEGITKESPWVEPHMVTEARHRVVGWRNGGGITKGEQERILQEDQEALQEYRDAKKAIAQGRLKEVKEPLAGLPPTWQAFWSTVPGMDAQAAYRAYKREEAKREKAAQLEAAKKVQDEKTGAKPAAVAPGEEEDEETMLAEIAKMEVEVRAKKEALVATQRSVDEWDKKLVKARQLDKEEEVEAKRMKRTLDSASFAHGIVQGKIRSSDNYFTLLYEDTKNDHKRKMVTLQRSCALMNSQISHLKGEMRQLLKTAADKLPSHSAEEHSTPGTPSAMEDDVKSVKSLMSGKAESIPPSPR